MQQNQEQGWASPSWGLPDQTNVLDWVTLCGEAALAHQWVEQLLTNGHTTSVFDSEHRYSPVLWNMYFAQRQAMRLRGEQVLYFAYPHFLSWQEDEGLQVMPLFRWPVNLEPPRANRQTWEVSIATGAAPRLNPNWLASAAQQYPDTDWETALRQCFTVPEQASARLSELVLSMAEQTQWETATINPAITAFPSAQVMTGQARGGALVWAASLGLWSTEAGLDAGGQHWRVPVSPEQLNPPNAGLDLLDPWQQTALQMAHHNRYLLVKGASGSGKTHLLQHLIGQQLLQKRSVLVVARHLGSLHRVQQQLETFDLAHLSFVAHGAAVEAPLLSGLLAAYDRKPPRYPDYDGNAWRAYVGRMDRTRSRLDEYFRASRRPVFGQYAWSDVLGYYLSAARQESKALLGTQLTTQSFAFRPREYQQIVEAIRQTKPLFDRLASLQHPLQDLNAAIFIHQDRDESYTFIQETTEKLLAQARPLHQRYVRRQSQYADEWTAHSEQQYRNLLNHWQSIDELLATSTEEVGEELLRSSDSTLKLYAVFSGRFRQAIDRRAGLETAYRQLREAHQGGEIFEFQWLEDKQIRRLDSLRDNLRRYRAALDEWRAGLPDRLQEELIRLNFKTALPELEVSASVAGLEEELEHFIDEVNAVGLYQLPLQSKTLTLAKQQKNLEQIISQLERTLTGLADYDDFYAWQRNWFSLAEPARKVLSALIRVRPKHWEAAFGSWYFNECLVQNYQPLASLPSDSLQQFADDYALTSAQTPLVIRKTWESLRDAGARELRPLSRTWPEQAPDNFLAGQFAQAGSALTRFLPVWLVTPAVGAQLAPYFDQVLVVDAHTLGGDAAAWLHEARQVVLFSNQDHLTAQGSLVAQCERGDIPVAQLQESHRLPLLPRMAAGEVTVTYEQVEGRFLEDHLQNEVEAQAILRWLNQVEKMPNRTFPSVGILTATPAQRNLILQYFHTIKAKKQPGAEIIQQLERNGMQVLTWTEAVGQKFDQVVLSTVFGMIDAEGHLPADLPAWLSRARLEAAFSSVQQSLHLVTSVPEDELQAWLEQPTSGDGQWLALFLLAAEARATGQEAVLQQMQAAFPELQPPPLETPDSLPREVAHRLMDLLPGWSWEWKAPGPGKLPLLHFHNPEGQTALLLVDGFLAQSTYTHYSWEWNHRQALEREGYYLLSIQSEAWWKASGQEALRLSGALRGMATVATEEEE